MASKGNPPSSRGQQTISSFFAKKRRSSTIDLTEDALNEDLEPPTKKSRDAKVTSSFFDDSSGISGGPSGVPEFKDVDKLQRSSASRWRFSHPSRDEGGSSTAPDINSQYNDKSSGNPVQEVRAVSFREKLHRRDAAVTAVTRSEGCSDYLSSVPESSAHKLQKFAAEDSRALGKATRRSNARKAGPPLGPEGIPCTPLEEAVIQFKNKYPDIVLLVEVGYKFCFYGNDAKIAGQVLGFYYGLDRNFLRTSCPAHNLKVNVGVITQVETAALKKAGDNRNTLFERQLTQLYTPSTFIDDLDSNMDGLEDTTPSLMAIFEETTRHGDDKILVGVVSITPSAGDVSQTRLAHIQPSELLLPPKLSGPTEKMLSHFTTHGRAFQYLSGHYENQSVQVPPALMELPELVVVALALTYKHLADFGLSNTLLQPSFFHKFSSQAHMLLDASTIRNLEIYKNQTDFTEKGSLFSILNRTTTSFGKRQLRSWIARPLVNKVLLQQRVDAVEEARLGESPKLALLRNRLKGLPDLARGLSSIQYGRIAPKELAAFATALNGMGATFQPFDNPADVGCSTSLWTDIISSMPALKAPTSKILSSINLVEARQNNKTNLWADSEKFPAVENALFAILHVESELADELKKIRKLVKMPILEYITVLSDEFVIELPKDRAKLAPASWVRIGSTKNYMRFHSPEIIALIQEREQHKERHVAEANKAYNTFLSDIAQQYYALFRDTINKLATADCLMSLATMSLEGDFCKPVFVDELSVTIVDGRHPIIEQVRSEPFVPNSIHIGGNSPRNLVISGPNMGGKTSVVKLVALLVLMAQVGSYVPAESMSLSLHDAILTRMGASDDLAAGRSTFMVEIAETRDIIKSATEKSLVILDELGVGTSTFDGMAIAGAVLEHLCKDVRCQTLFITHYPTLARELEARYPNEIGNRHMSFVEDTRIDGRREIRFMYKLTEGISKGSFGIECARLAGLPEHILNEASSKALTMRSLMEERAELAKSKNILRLLQTCFIKDGPVKEALAEIKTNIRMMKL
ncbi:DNA mismatch repair protein MSH3 [Hysterangium stoloniferum]|nr:DNA mismatch repair protein MSH3 [Hysterangium stoloniferum]